MIRSEGREKLSIRRDTRVLYRHKGRGRYLLTNDRGPEPARYRMFEADKNGRFSMEGLLLGSIAAHDPCLVSQLEKLDCAFEEIDPDYFDQDPVVSGLIGQAVGDAFGVPVEFLDRITVRRIGLQDMAGCDTGLKFRSRWGGMIPAGAWSDDTSMTIAAMASIIGHEGGIDYDDIMKQFLNWWEGGEYTSLDNFPFGLGGTVDRAFHNYRRGIPAPDCGGKGFGDNGNGALMRIFPFSMYCILKDYTEEETLDLIRKASGITHGHEISALGCFIYTLFLDDCIRTRNPRMAYRNAVTGMLDFCRSRFSGEALEAYGLLFHEIGKKDFDPDTIPESGYVVDSLTTAIYSILHTDSYEEAIKTAVGFGYDTDTNACITGSIAGAMYGLGGIPDRWLKVLKKKEYLIRMGEGFSGVCRKD